MFRFGLQQVLDLRESHEREMATQLVHVIGEERSAQDALDDLRAIRAAGIDLPAPGATRSVGEMKNRAVLLGALDGQIATATDAVAAAGAAVLQAQAALTDAFKDRRVLDRLRERHEEAHRVDEEKADRRTMDDIAMTRFTQGAAR